MQAFAKWICTMPRRELVRGVVVLALAMMMLENWLKCLTELGRGDFAEGVEELKGLICSGPVVWGVLHDPAKWGFRVGVLVLVGVALGTVMVGILQWVAQTHPEHPVSQFILSELTPFWWLDALTRLVAMGVLAGAAISLRRLYKTQAAKA